MPRKQKAEPTVSEDDASQPRSSSVVAYTNSLDTAARSAHAELRALKQKKDTPTDKEVDSGPKRGVIYLGHIPHGFFENEMLGFFSQFGEVTQVRLSRNPKSGRSRGYAFLEFEDEEVASIVARTMNNYILAGKVLVCHRVADDKIHPEMFAGAGNKFRKIPWRLLAKQKQNAPRTEVQLSNIKKRNTLKEQKKRKKLQDLGIEYDFPVHVEEVEVKEPVPKKAKLKKTKKSVTPKIKDEQNGPASVPQSEAKKAAKSKSSKATATTAKKQTTKKPEVAKKEKEEEPKFTLKELMRCKVAELRTMCKDKGFDTSGTKAILSKRLMEA